MVNISSLGQIFYEDSIVVSVNTIEHVQNLRNVGGGTGPVLILNS